MELLLRVWDNGRRNIKLDQAKFIDIDSLNMDFEFTSNVAVQRVTKIPNNLFCQLTKTWTKRWPTLSELDILDLHC